MPDVHFHIRLIAGFMCLLSAALGVWLQFMASKCSGLGQVPDTGGMAFAGGGQYAGAVDLYYIGLRSHYRARAAEFSWISAASLMVSVVAGLLINFVTVWWALVCYSILVCASAVFALVQWFLYGNTYRRRRAQLTDDADLLQRNNPNEKPVERPR